MHMSYYNKLLVASQFLEPAIFSKKGFLIFDKLIDLHEQNPTKNKLLDSNDLAKDTIISNPSALRFFSERIRSDKEIALQAILDGGDLLDCLGKNLKADYDIVLAAVKNRGCAIVDADMSIRGNIDLTKAALLSCSEASEYIPSEIQKNTSINYKDFPTIILDEPPGKGKCKNCLIPF